MGEVTAYSTTAQRAKTVEERFWEKVEVGAEDECWPWRSTAESGTYGNFQVVRGQCTTSSRVAWSLTSGPIPEGMFVCHQCDYPPCCNPAHLFLGTAADNMADKHRKGRQRYLRGSDLPQTKLSDQDKAVVRARTDGTWRSHQELAAEFGVSPTTIYRTIKEKS